MAEHSYPHGYVGRRGEGVRVSGLPLAGWKMELRLNGYCAFSIVQLVMGKLGYCIVNEKLPPSLAFIQAIFYQTRFEGCLDFLNKTS